MKFDLLLWVINVLNLKFEWTALSSEHWGNHFSIIKNKTNHHPLFLSSPSFGIPMFSPALQNLKHHLQTHWNCWEPFSMSPWKFPAVYGKDVHPLGLTTVSLHIVHQACTGAWLLICLDCSLCLSDCLSVLEFPFNILTGERNTQHQVDSSPVFHQPASRRQISTLHSLEAV